MTTKNASRSIWALAAMAVLIVVVFTALKQG